MTGLFLLSGATWGAEAGLVTSLSGKVLLQDEKAPAVELKPFARLRSGSRLALDEKARLQLVYFEGGRQETWRGPGLLEVGDAASKAIKGGLQPEVKALPAVFVRQVSKTPSPESNAKGDLTRMRAMPSGGTLESVEKNYAEQRQKADPGDRNPELYLLAGYFELREYERLEQLLRQMAEKAPADQEIRVLKSLYARAIVNAKSSSK